MKYLVMSVLLLITAGAFIISNEKDSTLSQVQAKTDNMDFYLLEEKNGIKTFHKFFGSYENKIGLLDKTFTPKKENKLVFYTWEKEHVGKEINVELSKEKKVKKFTSKISNHDGIIDVDKPKILRLTNNKTEEVNNNIKSKFLTPPSGKVEFEYRFPEEGNWVVEINIDKKKLTPFLIKVNNNEYEIEKLKK